MSRESWKSPLGFILSCIGSAVGLANIWRFPYAVGQNGGSAFVVVYLVCLMLVGFPILISEIAIGRYAQANPYRVFARIGHNRIWAGVGFVVVLNAFVITAYYSAVAGWILGYLIEACRGGLHHFDTATQTADLFQSLVGSSRWSLAVHGSFIAICGLFLIGGISRGIELANKWIMPIFLIVLLVIVAHGLSLPGSAAGLNYLFSFRFEDINSSVVISALGHACFTLSAGQGTMMTYGSYLPKRSNIVLAAIPIALVDTLVSLLAAIAVFSLVFASNGQPDAGPSLIFQTLPLAFSQIPFGAVLAVLFFLMVTFAAITSEMSAMEPVIAYLVEERDFKRRAAVLTVVGGGFVLGLPVALASSGLVGVDFFGLDLFELFDGLTQRWLIPLCGLASLILVGWKFGSYAMIAHIHFGSEYCFRICPWLKFYLHLTIRYVAPVIVVLIFLS